uniref:Titin-like n=1 Tax=Populus trichocarpa TaxID=3694 RepID=A0A2K2C898_POPTR
MDKIEGPCVNIEEEEKIVKHVEAMEDGEADVEGKPKSIEKEIGGPEKYEEGEMKIEESVELETSNEVSSFEPGLSQGKEALSQTADAIVNSLDNPETVKEVCQEKEIKDSGTGDGTINEQRIGEERKEGEKSGSCSSFLDDKGTDVVKAIEKTENEKEGTTCDTMGGGTYIVEAGIDIQNEKETTPGTGEGMQDKRNTEDIATVAHKTQETEEMYSQQLDKPDVCMVSESESEEIVNKSPQREGQILILEKTAEVDSSEGENIKDGMNPEQKPDGLFVKHEENKQSMHQDLAMAEESTAEKRDMETPTVTAAENNTSDAVPITITTAQDHSVIEDDKIMDVVANIVPEHSKEEMSKYEDKIKETFALQDEAVNEKIENSLAYISGEIDTATSSECSEAIASAKEETPIKIPGESFEDKKEEKPIDADAVVDSGLPIEKSLLPTVFNEKIEDAGLELQYKNSSELHISHSLEQETIPVQDEKQPKLSDFEPQEQDHEENGPSKDLEKHAEDASEACESMQNTNLENPSAEGAITTEVNSKANEMAVEKEEKIHELESEEKLAIDDAGTNLEEEMQKKEKAHDEQAYQMATSDRVEEVTSDEVCSREFVDKKVERSVQAAGFQEAETPSKNGVGENYEMSSIVNEEVIDEPKITDIGEVIDEEKIKYDATHLSSELVFDEKLVESSQDNETEAEMSKGDGVEEQMMKDDNAKVILQESIQEASVNDFQNDLKNAEKSSREMSEVSEAEEKDETNNNDESPDSTLQASPLKEQESLQTENLTAEAEEKDEDGSSIRKDEHEDNDDGLKEVKECSEKETLKGEEDVEQISPMNEPGENPESSASMISAETEEVALNKTTQKTEEEMDEGVEGVKKEGETGKEDGEEQVIDENDAKSIPVESIKEVPVSKLLNDENNAEEFKREISEESVAAGTNESITDATYQNDGTPNAALETSTVKQVEIVQGEGKDTIPAEASPEEEEEHDRARGFKRVGDNSSEIKLEEDLEKSDEETSKNIDAVAPETNQHIEFPNSTLETSPVEEQASVQRDNLTPEETSPEEKKYENIEVHVVEESNINSLSQESAEEIPIKDFQNAAKNSEKSTEEMLESQIAGGDETNTNDEDCNSSLTISVDKIDESFEGEDKNITTAEASTHDEKEEHGSWDRADDGNDSNCDLTVTNQDSAREALKVQEDFEKKLQRIEPGDPEESSTVMAAETEAGNLSDKIDDITSQEEVVTVQNIEETVEKEKKEERGPLDRADDGNDSNPDLTVTNLDSAREASKVQEDSEQELQRIEPGEPEESSTVMAAETEAGTLSDKIDDVTSQEEVVTVPNIEETIEKEKKEGSEDIDVTKVKRAVMEEDLKLVAEASDANKSVENDAEEENIISGGKDVETVEKTFGLDSIQKLEVEEKRENKEEETMNEDIKEVCGDTKIASLSVDAEKHVTTEEHSNTDISPQTTGETTAEEKAKTVKEMEESVITVDEDAEKKFPEEESAINDQSRIIYKGDESGMLVEQEVHEIIQTAEEYGDIGKQGSVIKDSYEVPLSSTNEENPLHKETEDESDKVKPNEEVKDSKSEFTEPFEARGSVDRQEFETLRGKQGPNSDIYLVKASEGVSEKESNKSPVEISYLESESKGEILEEVQPDVNDSSSALTTGITRETSFKEAEPEDKRQIESFEPAPQEKGPVTESTERTTLESVDIDAKPEDSNFIENEDHEIPAASEAEELENEMHEETPITGSEDYKEETTNETSLGNVLDDKQVECSTMLPQESELMTNEGKKATDENSTTYENIETLQTPQEIEITLKEDMPINARDASKSLDPGIESIKEELGSYQFDNLNEHHELDNEKQEGIDISKSSEIRDLANQGEICKLMSLEDGYSSNVGDEALKCIEATSAERKEVILEEDNSTKKYEDSLTDNVEANKAAFELEEGTNNQEQAIGNKDYGVLAEENFEVSESGKKLEGVSESETGDQSSQKIPETDPGKVENITEIQNKSLKSVEQSSLESQEVREETGEKTEPRFETEGDVKETQNTDETVKDVLLTKEVHEKVDKAGSETLKCTEKDVNDTLELCAKSTEDERVHEVKESSLIAEECHEATESNEQTAIMSSDFQETPTMEEMSLAKAINDEDNEMPAVLSTTKPAEESDEMIKIIKEEDSCCDKIKATTMVEIAKTSLEEAQLDEKPVQVSNITSNDSVSLEIEAEACQQEKIKDNVGLELPSNLASPILIDDHENIMREQVAKENTDADDVQENERASDVVYESKDNGIEELITSKIKEENEKSSEIVESLGVEAAANEIAIGQNPPEVISKEEQGISATTERREENMKDVELLEDDLRKTEEVPLQKDDCRERDISQLELQSNKEIQNQSPKEVLEEECGIPDETKEEIKEGPKLASMTNSQGFEALKEDESTSGQTVPEEKLEEQNQTSSAALLSKEKDCGTEMIIENIEECMQVEIPTDPQNDSPKKITEDTCLHKEETNELEVSGFGVELNTGMQKDSLNEVQVEESKSPDDASKLQTPEYETGKEAFESMSEAHGHKGFTASEETEIEEKHLEVAITDLAVEGNRSEKIIDPAEIIHDEVIEEGTFERTTNLKTELSEEAFKSISEVHGHESLAESEDTEIKEKNPEVTVTDMAAEENRSERTIDATEIIHDKLKSEEIMEEKEGSKNGDHVTLGEETTKVCQEEYELKAEESLGDKGTQKDIQNEELYKEVEKADGIEKQMDTERIIERLHLAAAENETMKESFLDEAGSGLHLENQICETAFGNDGRTEAANVKEEEKDVEISQKEVPADLVEANEATRDIHEEEETSKTTTEHIEEHVKEVEIEVDEHPSAPKTTVNTCSQKEETKEQEVCGSGVECSTDMQKNGSNEFDEEEGRTPDEDSTLQPQGYENKIKDKEYQPESNEMTEITEKGAFEKTSDLRADTGEEAFKSVSEVHEHEVLAESEHAEIKKEKHTEVAVTDLVAGENQNKKTIDATDVVHDELTNEELTKQDKQQFKEEKEDTKNCNPINLGEETTKESRQIYDLKAEKSQEDKMENEIQNEEVSNESGEYLHPTAVENETINESFPDEALVKNAEDMGTKLQVENHSDEKISGYDRTEATTITNEEFGTEISEKESLQAPAEANETTQDIHQGERDSDSTSEKPIPIEAEPQETTERKKDAPQVLLQEPIVEATQGAGVGESESAKATGIVDAQGFEHKAERSIDEENIRGNDESMSAKTSLFDMMQSSTRERQVGGDLTEETRVEGEKAKSDEEKEEEEEEEEEGEEHKKTDSGSDAPVMVEASRDIVEVKVASKKHYNILSGVGSKVKNSISKVKKAITGKSSHPKQHSPK